MGWLSFVGGAAKSLKKDRDTELAIQQELDMMEAKNKMLMELQRRNEKIAQGIDPSTGEAFTIYGDGTTQTSKLPQGYVDQLRAQQEAAAAERRLKQDKLTAETDRARADAEYKGLAGKAAERRAAAAEAAAASRGIADRARAGYYDRGGSQGASNTAEKEADAMFKNIEADRSANPEAKRMARRIRYDSTLSPAEKIKQLMEVTQADDYFNPEESF